MGTGKERSPKWIDIIKDMYEGAVTSVRANGEEKKEFPVTVGLHQGSALSPYLLSRVGAYGVGATKVYRRSKGECVGQGHDSS